MPCYRLYHLNRFSGHIDRVERIDAADDIHAVELVKECEHENAVELWQEGRKVWRLEASTNMSEPTGREGFRDAVAG
jgi:hypothetical protein